MRSSAFIPFEREGGEPPTRQQLLDSSAYFRLELGLAVRAKTPAIVFVDRRFGSILDAPSTFSCAFDHQEVTGKGGSPNRPRFQEAFERFANGVEVSMRYERTRSLPQSSVVGFLLPPDAYDATLVSQLESLMSDANIEIERLPWPPRLDGRLISRLQSFDWVVSDVGIATANTGLAGYLHGQFIPTLRLARQTESGDVLTRSSGTLREPLWRSRGRLSQGHRDVDDARRPAPGFQEAARAHYRGEPPHRLGRGRSRVTFRRPRCARKRCSSATPAPTKNGSSRLRPPCASASRRCSTTGMAASRSSPADPGWKKFSSSSIAAPLAS